jgi:hypothetical protein
MGNKLDRIAAFDVDRYLAFHAELYKDIPANLLEAQQKENENALAEWEQYKGWLYNNSSANNSAKVLELSPDDKNALEELKEYKERQQWADFLADGGMGLLDADGFGAMTAIVEVSKTEILDISKTIEHGFTRKDFVLGEKLTYYSDLVDMNILDLAANGQYLFKEMLIDAAVTFANVKICQWIIDQTRGNINPGEKKPLNAAQKVAFLYVSGIVGFIDNFGASVPETEKAKLISILIDADDSNIRKYLMEVRSSGKREPAATSNNKKYAEEWIKSNMPKFDKAKSKE